MKLVIQRCQEASVSVNGKTVGAIEKGLMVLIGVGKEDTTEVVDKYLKKLLQLRIFEDENGKTNRSLMDIGGQLLLVSQFTLYANCRHGNRPSFTDAGDPQRAEQLYEYMSPVMRAAAAASAIFRLSTTLRCCPWLANTRAG